MHLTPYILKQPLSKLERLRLQAAGKHYTNSLYWLLHSTYSSSAIYYTTHKVSAAIIAPFKINFTCPTANPLPDIRERACQMVRDVS